jgi:hypothetical protein
MDKIVERSKVEPEKGESRLFLWMKKDGDYRKERIK